MAPSNPSASVSQAHFSAEPASPKTVQPLILAICPARIATADHDACVHGNSRQTDIQYLAADVVEVDVDAVWTQPVEFGGYILSFVVDGAVESQRVR